MILCRPSYRRDDPSQYSRGGEGDYSIRGYLSRPEDQLSDGRSYYSRQFGYRRSYDGFYGRAGGGTCPYQNQKLSRKRREAGTEDSEDRALKTRLRNLKNYNSCKIEMKPCSGGSLSSLCMVAGTTMMRATTETPTGAGTTGTTGTTETDTTTDTLIGGSEDGAELDMTIVGGETRLGLDGGG